MKMFRKITGIVLAMTLVFTSVSVMSKNTNAAVVNPVTNLKVYSYADWTGKYLIYFTPSSNAEKYKLFIDDATKPVAEISQSGEYVTNDDLNSVSAGEHYLRVAGSLTVDGVEYLSEKASVKFTKSDREYEAGDIPQVYIKTNSGISYNYFDTADVNVTVVDQDDGSKGRAYIDDEGEHKDEATIKTYNTIIDSKSNIKVRGNTTSTQPKRSWNIKFSGKTAVLGMPKGKKWCLLANSMDKSLMRDTLSYNFGLENGVKYTSQSRYVDVYLNGEFKGNYQLCEPVEAKSNRVEINAYDANNNDILLEVGTRNEEGVDHFKTSVFNQTFDVNDPEKGDDLTNEQVDAKIDRARTLLNEFEATLRDHENDLNAISQHIDVNSFIDYYIANEVFKNVDFNFSSTRFYIKDDRIYAGPMWDLDLSSGNCKSSYYTSYYIDGDSSKGYYCRNLQWYKRLFRNEEFNQLVAKRFYDLQYKIQSLYRSDSTETNSIDYLINRYGTSFARNYTPKARFGAGWDIRHNDGYSYAAESDWLTWNDPIEFLRDWLIRRNTWMCQQWEIDMDQAYEDSKEWYENPTTAAPTTPRPTTTAAPTTTTEPTTTVAPTTTVKPTTVAPTTVKPTNPVTDAPTTAEPSVAPTTEAPVEPTAPTTKAPTTKKPSQSSAKQKETYFLGTTKVKKAKRSAKKIRVKLRKVKYADGYQVMVYKTKANAIAKVKHIVKKYVTSLKATIKSKKIKKKKKYYVRARAYMLYNGGLVFGDWSAVKKTK